MCDHKMFEVFVQAKFYAKSISTVLGDVYGVLHNAENVNHVEYVDCVEITGETESGPVDVRLKRAFNRGDGMRLSPDEVAELTNFIWLIGKTQEVDHE